MPGKVCAPTHCVLSLALLSPFIKKDPEKHLGNKLISQQTLSSDRCSFPGRSGVTPFAHKQTSQGVLVSVVGSAELWKGDVTTEVKQRLLSANSTLLRYRPLF